MTLSTMIATAVAAADERYRAAQARAQAEQLAAQERERAELLGWIAATFGEEFLVATNGAVHHAPTAYVFFHNDQAFLLAYDAAGDNAPARWKIAEDGWRNQVWFLDDGAALDTALLYIAALTERGALEPEFRDSLMADFFA